MIDDTVEQLARWLHDETGHPDSYPDHTWPETERDDGRREGGWVKIVPQHAQAYFRDIARRMVARFPLNESQAAPVLDREVLHQAAKEGNLQYWRDAEKQRSAFDEWRLAGYVGDCPQFAKGSVVDYITDAILATLSLPRPNPQTPD